MNDDRGVPLVGKKSFGKGTVQQLVDLPDGSSLKITVAHWVLPSGRILDHDGLVPNYPVPLTDAEIAAGQDPQMAKALQVVHATRSTARRKRKHEYAGDVTSTATSTSTRRSNKTL